MADDSVAPKARVFHGGKAGRKCPPKISIPSRPCTVCGEAFFPQREWSRYCSVGCRDKRKIEKIREHEPLIPKKSTKDAPWGTGICPTCGSTFVATRSGKKYCSFKCSRLRLQRNWKNKNRAAGHCYSCKEPPLVGTVSYCRKHWLVQAAWRAGLRGAEAGLVVEEILIKQGYKCAYTGNPLVIGVNASIDHKNPRSTNPELLSSVENLEWVDEETNRAKRGMTRDEYITHCRAVVEHEDQKRRDESRPH